MKPLSAKQAVLETIHLDSVGSFQDRREIGLMLDCYENADAVLRVIQLDGSINRGHACYTLAPIIRNIGNRTPEQYVADTDEACRLFALEHREYVERFRAAKTNKEREAVVAEQARKWGL